MNVEFLKGALLSNEQGVRIVFTKADGSERVLHGTLNPRLVPSFEGTGKGTRSVSTETLAVYDLEKQARRSFRYDSVIEVSFKDYGTEVIYTP